MPNVTNQDSQFRPFAKTPVEKSRVNSMVFEVFRTSGCLITCRYSKRQRENEHPEQLRSSQGFGEEPKVTRFRFNHLKRQAPMLEAWFPYQQFLLTCLRNPIDNSRRWSPSAALWQVPC